MPSLKAVLPEQFDQTTLHESIKRRPTIARAFHHVIRTILPDSYGLGVKALRIMPYVIILQWPSWVWLTACHADRSPSSSEGSEARKGPSEVLEQWRKKPEPHEQVAVGQKTSRPSEAQMKTRLDKLQRKAEGE